MHIRKNRILRALTAVHKHNFIEDIPIIDDLQALIRTVSYNQELKIGFLINNIRLKRLKGWHTTRSFIMENIENRINSLLIETPIYYENQPFAQDIYASPFIYSIEQEPSNKISNIGTPKFIQHLLAVNDSPVVIIGPQGTHISKNFLSLINWSSSNTIIIRKILMEVFDHETLATHSLSGKQSPAFLGCNKPVKQQLDGNKVNDIIYLFTNSLNISEKEVRRVISVKCCDENKKRRMRAENHLKSNHELQQICQIDKPYFNSRYLYNGFVGV